MRSYTVRDFFAQAPGLERALREVDAAVTVRFNDLAARLGVIVDQRATALGQLVRHLLPDLSPAACERAGRAVGFAAVLDGNPQRRREDERVRLHGEVDRVAADPRWIDRDALRARLTAAIADHERARAPSAALVDRAAHPRLERLLANGYDTPAYDVGWWRLSYYGDWKAGDEIVDKFGGVTAFAEVRAQVVPALAVVATHDRALAGLRAELATVDELIAYRERCQAQLTTLDADHLTWWRTELTRHVGQLSPHQLAVRLPGDAAGELLLKTAIGLDKKHYYLSELSRTHLDPLAERARDGLTKLERDRRKYSRPKKAYTRFPADKFERRFRDRSARHVKILRRYDRAVDALSRFDDYGRGRLDPDFLWWDLMTGGRLDGRFCAEVTDFLRDHPGYVWDGGDDDDDDVLAAAAVIAADRVDDLTAFDPS